VRKQQFLKAASRTARAEVVATELLDEQLVPVNDAQAALDLCLGGEAIAPFAGDFEAGVFLIMVVVCHTASGLRVAVASSRAVRDEFAMGKGLPWN
jgi:hypothetical protein